jgi:hypothetical protein
MSLVQLNAQYNGGRNAEIFREIFLLNNTLNQGLARIVDGVKGNQTLTDAVASVTLQAYKAAPVVGTDEASDLSFRDILLQPVQHMLFDSFNPATFRQTFFNRDAIPGAINSVGDEFLSEVIFLYGGKMSQAAEVSFWQGATSTTKTAIAALTAGTGQNAVGAAEKTLVGNLPAGFFDGVVTKMISTYSNDANRRRYKVAGTTITTTNLLEEYGKLYAAIPLAYNGSALLQTGNVENQYIYAPHSHLALINQFNNDPTKYKDAFIKDADGDFTFNGIKIKFVPLPANTMIFHRWNYLVWGTDIESDFTNLTIAPMNSYSAQHVIRADFSLESAIMQPGQAVLYVG